MGLRQVLNSLLQSSAKSTRRRSSRAKSLQLELLEQRALLTGNVQIQLTAGDAVLTGDTADNSVEIVAENNTLIARGLNGTTLNGGTSTFVLSSSSTTFGGRIDVSLNAGNDTFAILSGVTVTGKVDLRGGVGNDTLGVAGTLNQSLMIDGGVGTNTVNVQNATATKGATISSTGAAVVNVANSTIAGLSIQTGHSDDDIVLSTVTINGSTVISTNGGNDDIVVRNSTLNGSLTVDAGKGEDVAFIDATTITGNVSLWMRQGNDSVQIQGTSNLQRGVFVGALWGRDSLEIASPAVVPKTRRLGKPANGVNDALITSRITDATTGAIAKATAAGAQFDAKLTVAVVADSVAENAGATATTMTVTRSGSTTSALTVTLASSNTSKATVPATVVIPAGQSSATVSITAVNNTTFEPSAVVTFTATATGFTTATDTLTVTNEDVAALTVTAVPSTISENAGASAVTFTVSRNSADLAQPLTVNLSSDKTTKLTVGSSVVIPANASSVTFVGAAVDNTTIDGNTTAIVTATATGFENGTFTVTVNDNESPTLTVSPSPSSVAENAGASAVTFTVTRTNSDNTQPLTVNLSSGTTSKLTVPSSVIIPANASFITFVGAAVDNTTVESSSQVVVSVSATGFTAGQTTVTVTDNDSTLTVSAGVATVAENAGASAVTYTVTRSAADITQPLTVNLSSNNTNKITVGSSVVIPANATFITFSGAAIDNTVADGSSQVVVTASSVGFANGTATVTVTDNESPALTVTAAPLTFSENAGAAAVEFTVTRNTADLSQAVTVNLSSGTTSKLTVPASVIIPANAASVNFTGAAVDNTTADGSSQVVVSATATGFAQGQGTVTVTDNDSVITLTSGVSSVAENAGSSAVTFTVERNSTNLTQPLTVSLSSNNVAGMTVPSSIVIPANAASVTFVGAAVDDTVVDPNSTVIISAGASGFTTGTRTITVTNDDVATLLVTSPASFINENSASPITFTVTRNTSDISQAVTVALNSNTVGRLTVPPTVTIPANSSSATFAGTPVPNTASDGNVPVIVTASSTNPAFVSGLRTVSVIDDETASLTLTSALPSISENSATNAVSFTVTRHGSSTTAAQTVTLTSATPLRLTVPASVIIPAGQSSFTFSGSTVNNDAFDGNADVVVTAAATGLTSGTTSLTVIEDELAPSLSLSLTKTSVSEGAGTNAASLTVTRQNSNTTQALLVTLGLSDSTRLSVPATLTIPAGQSSASVNFNAIDNGAVDGSLPVTITTSVTGSTFFANRQTLLTVTDDENAVLSWTPSTSSVLETVGTLNATVRSSVASTTPITVNLAYSDSTKLSGPASVIIPAGQTSAPVTFTVERDSTPSQDVIVRVTATAIGATTAESSITIRDSDLVPLTTSIASNTTQPSNGTVITQNPVFRITGTTSAGAAVAVDSDGDGVFDDATTTAANDGAYTVDVTLTNNTTNNGANHIIVKSTLGSTTSDADINAHLAVGTVVRFQTALGTWDAELLNTATPNTVSNFLEYVNSPTLWNNMIVQRSDDDFVIQAGGFTQSGGEIRPVTPIRTLTSEFTGANSNVRGTMAMALSGAPNTGTNQWFISMGDNSFLDNQSFTVFGRVIGTGMTVVDQINNLTPRDFRTEYANASIGELPLRSFAPANTPLTGTVSTTSGSPTLTGVGTLFTTQLAVGQSIKVQNRWYFVASIQSNTSLTLTASASATTSAQTAQKDVAPSNADFVVFSDISTLLSAL